MASGNSTWTESGGVSSSSPVSEETLIDRELRENGIRVDLDDKGFAVLRFIGFEMEISPKLARGRFVVDHTTCQPFGVLHGGITAHIAESLVSAAGGYAANKRVAGVELNVNHLRAVPVGCAVTVIARPLMQGNRIQVWEVKYEAEMPKKSTTRSEVDPPEKFLSAVARVTLIVGLPVENSMPIIKAISRL